MGVSAGSVPHVSLAELPTRVHSLEAWSRRLGAAVWVKRDDETSRLYGGNKPRKLEFILADALARRCRTILTFGGLGTHHGLATTVFARELGIRTVVGLLYQPVTPAVRENLLCLHALGASLFYGRTVTHLATQGLGAWARLWLQGGRPYLVPTGGSSVLGTLGFVVAAFELAEQVRAHELPEPTYIVVPLGSGGTVAGLVLGLKIAGLASQVVGVLVTDIHAPSASTLARLANRTGRYLVQRQVKFAVPHISAEEFVIERGCLGAGYGAPLGEATELAAWLKAHEGLSLDDVYAAKAALALERGARERRWKDGPVLFWLTFSRVRVSSWLPRLPDFRELPQVFQQFFIPGA